MEFNSEHKVIVDTLSKEEAKMFVGFLEDELERHKSEIQMADIIVEDDDKNIASRRFYQSAIMRHANDICEINSLIVKDKFSI